MQNLITVFIVLLLFSCKQKEHGNQIGETSKPQKDNVSFSTLIEPSFSEVSLIDLKSDGDSSHLQILIKNNVRVDETQDTFYFKKVALVREEYNRLDTAVLQKAKQNISPKEHVSVDGMSVSFNLNYQGEKYRFGYFSPSKKSNEAGFVFTKSTIDNFKTAFKDSVVSDYLDEVEAVYIDESKLKRLTEESQKAISELRKQKYSR
jgi:hypothetical protein